MTKFKQCKHFRFTLFSNTDSVKLSACTCMYTECLASIIPTPKAIAPQGSHSQILAMGGGRGDPTENNILYPKKSQLQNLSTQKNH